MRLENPIRLQSTFIEFAGDRVPDVAPSGMARLYYDQSTGLIKVSANGGAYGGGIGTRLRDLTEQYLPGPPLNSSVSSLVTFGSVGALAGASASGTWLGINHSSAGPDYLNFQVAGTSKFRVYGTGSVDMAGTLTLGTGTAALSADSTGQITAGSPSTATSCFRAGRGKALGQPPGTIVCATGGAGPLTGTFQYAYSEGTGVGRSSLSAATTYVAAGETVQVTIPIRRRGTDDLRLYRTVDGGSTFKLLKSFGSGIESFKTVFLDTVADGSLGAASQGAVDSSQVYEFEATSDVKYFRTHPDQGSNAADLTLVTGDPATGGAYGIDNYGSYFGRVKNGNGIGIVCYGTTATAIQTFWLSDIVDGVDLATTFVLEATGNITLTPTAMTTARPYALNVAATFPTTNAAEKYGTHFTLTGAGSSSFEQQAFRVDVVAGYTGSSANRAIYANQGTASTGSAYAIFASASGAAATNIGVEGVAQSGTKNVGGWFTIGGTHPEGVNASMGLGCSNSTATDDIFRAYDGTSLMFRIQDGGKLNLTAISASEANTGDFWHDTTLKALKFWNGRTVYSLPGIVATQIADATVGNSSAEATVLGTLTGTKTLAASFFTAGKSIRVRAWGYLSSTGTPNLTIKLKFGSTVILTTGAVAQSGTPSNVLWQFDGTVTCRTTGASGTVYAQGYFRYGSTFMPTVSTATVTIDTTASQVLDLTAQWSAADPGNTLTGTNFSLEVLN